MASPVESKQGGARVRIPPPLVLVAFLLAGFLLRPLVAPPPLPFSRTVQIIIGGVLFLAAVALGGSARGLFSASGQDLRPWMPSPSLLVGGPYRLTRNPMYVAMFILEIAIGCFAGDLWIVLLAPMFLVTVHYTAVLREEAYLEEKFGDEYRAYKRRVRRYL